MNCAGFEQGLANVLGSDAAGAERARQLEPLRRHASACDACRASADLLDLLELPAAERDIVDDPGESYWSSFEERLQLRLKQTRSRSQAPWWAVAAAVVSLGLLGAWLLRGPSAPDSSSVVANGGTGPTSMESAHAEFPSSLVQSLDQASAEEVEDQLAALEALGSGWSYDAAGAGEMNWGGELFPEVERLDSETRERLLEWLRDQNREIEGAQG